MSRSASAFDRILPERFRSAFGRRAVGIALTVAVEAVLILVLLTLAPRVATPKGERTTVFGFAPEPEVAAAEDEPEAVASGEREVAEAVAEKEPEAEVADRPPTPAPPLAEPAPAPPPAIIPLSPEQMAAADISRFPAAPASPARRAVAGPPNRGGAAPDTPRVEGTGPNGEPLYAASWYREPYPEELRGYLSTAQGPGWGLIACRTVRDYRVEDCVALDEWPERSNIARSVLAAAWQFRVRPPRLGGELKVGEWVRIRIDYGLKRN